ncbi:RNA-directed DNA polymerase from mobile element jockey [Eumeta japonica]|uniref:RNA-directed DNA polymerase from mobile element jockey n=1 Tax=Eumeta variegata TaxID=151549 RepID=A0A4C1X2V4_EUMVA|nr:RNA-directed DNA polymerase from mobile element jockey [Eumeta japonica]
MGEFAACAVALRRLRSLAPSQMLPYIPSHNPQDVHRIKEKVRQKISLAPKDDVNSVSLDEVQSLIKNLNTRKSPGLDGISNKAIKCFSLPLMALVVAIFNVCLKNCYFPPSWKEGVIIGILKSGKLRDLTSSFRPISLLSGLGKLYDKIQKTRLSNYVLNKNLIINEQFGFRFQYSCPQLALRLVEHISEGFKKETQNSGTRPSCTQNMKDASEILQYCNQLPQRIDFICCFLRAPPANNFIRRPRNVVTDPLEDLIAKVEKLNNALKDLEE